jgi:carboxymethylenebutenolidase
MHLQTCGTDPGFDFASLDRRAFIKKMAILAGGVATAKGMLCLWGQRSAHAAVIPADDPRLAFEEIRYPGATGEVSGYLAKPRESGRLPGVIVIHENRGLNAHIRDVTRRVALGGFMALAPDADKARELINSLDQAATIRNFAAAAAYLKTHPMSTGKVGVVGFCWGGAMANQLAVHSGDVQAAVPYYGRQPAAEDVPGITASLLLHYAGLDERINAGIPDFEAALKKAGVEYTLYMYPGAKHAFNNDTNPERYNSEAAEIAWKRTMDFLSEKLKE